jgi:hypothetical protein
VKYHDEQIEQERENFSEYLTNEIRLIVDRMRSFFLTLVAAVSAFSLLATPAEAGGKRQHQRGWNDDNRPARFDRHVLFDRPVFIQLLWS